MCVGYSELKKEWSIYAYPYIIDVMSKILALEAAARELIPMETLERVTPMLRAIAHPVRLRILDYLRREGEPRTVSEIESVCGVQQAVVSQQLRILKDQGVLRSERQGTHVLYDLVAPNVLLVLACIRQHPSER